MSLPEPTSVFEYTPRSPRLNSFSSSRNSPLPPNFPSRSASERPNKTACISIDPPNKIPPHINEDSFGANEKQQYDLQQMQQPLSSSPSNSQYTSSPTLSALDNLSNQNDDDYCKTPTLKLAETAESVRVVAKQIANARVRWAPPRTVLIITKAGDAKIVRLTRELASWLITTPRYGDEYGVTVYVDSKLENSRYFNYAKFVEKSDIFRTKLLFWTPALCRTQSHLFDFVVTLGGDGTVLFASWLFQTDVPPVLPFHLGSLGFLTNFDFAAYKEHLKKAMEEGARINLRTRFTCKVYRCKKNVVSSGNQQTSGHGRNHDEDMVALRDPKTNKLSVRPRRESDPSASALPPCITTVHTETFEILNDLVVDRGPSPYMSMLELFGDDQHLTTVQADGLVLSTPTGSTAYSLSAGGPLTHPEIPAFLVTPICPHTLSFRPMLLPDSMELRICVPLGSRSTAWASFDGRGRIELKQGDHIKISASSHPFPTICSTTHSADWFNSLSRCLRWNERQRQKSFVVVESSPPKKTKRNRRASISSTTSLSSSVPPSSASSIASTAPSSVPTSPISEPISQPPPVDEFFALIVSDQKSYQPMTSTMPPWGDSTFYSDEREDTDEDEEWASDDSGEELVGWTDDEIFQGIIVR